MTDGLRWQELFHGADASLLTTSNYYDNRNVDALEQQFLSETVKERREKLMPFVWGTLATVPILPPSDLAHTIPRALATVLIVTGFHSENTASNRLLARIGRDSLDRLSPQG